jgi:hypothetical protein
MRQAGRYMSEYRELRAKYEMLEIIKQPELACQVTMQPIEAFDLDAAIIFADILPPLEGLGLKVGFQAGEGPTVYNPVRSEADVLALAAPDIEEATWFTLEAIRLARRELEGRGLPLIGFSGAPFTLACYAVEGGSSKDFAVAKRLMMGRPDIWRQLMEKLTVLVGGYLRAQAPTLYSFSTPGRVFSARRTTRSSLCPITKRLSGRSPRKGCRSSISRPVPAGCSNLWRRLGPTFSESTGASIWERLGDVSAPALPSRGTSTQ